MRVNTKTLLTIASVSFLFVACGLAPNKEEQDLAEILTIRLDSLTKVIENDQKTNVSEEVLLMQKVLEWRLDSIEKTQKFNDSLNAYYKAKEEIIRDSIRILQREKDSLEAIKNAHQTPMLVNGGMNDTIQNRQYEGQLPLTQAIAQKDLLIAQQNEMIHQNYFERDSIENLNRKEISKSNPEVKAMQANIIAQMNYCILTSYYIKNSPTLEFFENKKREMNNDLTQESIKGVKEVHDYRQKIRETLDELIINEYEKQIYFDVLDIEKKNRKLNAARNALQVPQLSVNPFSAIANTVLTIARAGIDLAVSKNEYEIQNKRSMWEFQREYLKNEFQLGRQGFDYITPLYDKYDLKEYDRLTENDINRYFNAISEPDPETRSRRLEYDSLVFKNLHDYYYNLGMAYIDADSTEVGYKRAEPYFDKYLEQYTKFPLFRTDENTGIIALTRLLRGSKSTSNEYKETLIREIEKNLPNNEFGYAVGSMEYYTMGNYEKAFRLLQKGIDNVENDEVLLELAFKYMNEIREYPEIHHDICGAILSSKSLTLQEYASCVIAMNNNTRNDRLKELMVLQPKDSLNFYLKNQPLLKLTTPKTFIEQDVQVYYESVTDTDTYVYEYNMRPFGVSRDELYANAELLSKNTDIISFFFEGDYSEGKDTLYIKVPFDKTLFHGGSFNYQLIRGKLNTINYTHQQTDSLFKEAIRYCADLSICREELLFSNHHKEKIDSIENLISVCDVNLRLLTDSTKTLEEKAQIFKNRTDSIKNIEEKVLAQIESIKKQIENIKNSDEELNIKVSAQIESIRKQIEDLNNINDGLDVRIEDLNSANRVQKQLIKWGRYKDSSKYHENKKRIAQLESCLDREEQNYNAEHNKNREAIIQLESSLSSEENKLKNARNEYEQAINNYKEIETECNGININAIVQQKENLEKELASLYKKEGNVYIYGDMPKYVRRENVGNGDYLKVILGKDNGNFEKVVFTYKKEGNNWLFYASEMIDGSKYRLVQ